MIPKGINYWDIFSIFLPLFNKMALQHIYNRYDTMASVLTNMNSLEMAICQETVLSITSPSLLCTDYSRLENC